MPNGGRPSRSVPVGPEAVLRVGSRIRCSAGALRWVAEVTRLLPYRSIDLRCVDGDLRGPLGWEFDAQPRRHARAPLFARRSAALRPSTRWRTCRRYFRAITADAFAGMRRMLETAGGRCQRRRPLRRAASRNGRCDHFARTRSRTRSCARFSPRPRARPSARNAQPWHFVAVRDPALKTAIGSHYLAAWRQAQAFIDALDADADIKDRPDYPGMMRRVDALAVDLDRAPVLVLCCLDLAQLGLMADADGNIRAPQSAYASIYPAVQNLMLAARGLGVGSTLTTVFLSAEGDMRRALGIPDHVHIAALVPLGYPARPFRVTARKPVDAVAFLDRWGNPLPKP